WSTAPGLEFSIGPLVASFRKLHIFRRNSAHEVVLLGYLAKLSNPRLLRILVLLERIQSQLAGRLDPALRHRINTLQKRD
ncbi:MAG: hypothetical protein ACM3N3_22305, partial [Betaproteobacteria bacterium]